MDKIYCYAREMWRDKRHAKRNMEAQVNGLNRYTASLLKMYPHLESGGIYVDTSVRTFSENFHIPPAARELLTKIERGDHLVLSHFLALFTAPKFLAFLDRQETLGITVHLMEFKVSTKTATGRIILKVVKELAEASKRNAYHRERSRAKRRRERERAGNR